jgi:type II secretory pathway component PulJ
MARANHDEDWPSRGCPPPRSGFTFLELLVATLLMTAVGAVFVNSFRIEMRHRADAEVTAETYQGLVAALDSLTRDVRLAGACLPTQPLFVPLSGAHDGRTDAITVRTGAIGPTPACAVASLMGPHSRREKRTLPWTTSAAYGSAACATWPERSAARSSA